MILINVTKARVHQVSLKYLSSSVGTPIINDNKFPVLIALAQRAFNCPLDYISAIPCRRHDADEYVSRRLRDQPSGSLFDQPFVCLEIGRNHILYALPVGHSRRCPRIMTCA